MFKDAAWEEDDGRGWPPDLPKSASSNRRDLGTATDRSEVPMIVRRPGEANIPVGATMSVLMRMATRSADARPPLSQEGE